MLKTCQAKCIPDEYGEADLNKGEIVCIDRCVAKYYNSNLKIGQVSVEDPNFETKIWPV